MNKMMFQNKDWKEGILDFIKDTGASLSFFRVSGIGLKFKYDFPTNELRIYSENRIEPFGFTKVKEWPKNWDVDGLEIDKLYLCLYGPLGKITNCKINELRMFSSNISELANFDLSQVKIIGAFFANNLEATKYMLYITYGNEIWFEKNSHFVFLYFKKLILDGCFHEEKLMDSTLLISIDQFIPFESKTH